MSIRTDAVHDPAIADTALLRANKLDLLERLADDLAHEIKNPLHSMVINLEVLKRRAARMDVDGAEDLQRYATVIGSELERVNRRIELLLRLCRPGRGSDLAGLGELLDELMELVQLEARRHEAVVDYDPASAASPVRLPRESGRQIILNLILDALEGAGSGGRLRLVVARDADETRFGVERIDHTPDVAGEPLPDRLSAVRVLAAAAGGTVEDRGPASRTLVLPVAAG